VAVIFDSSNGTTWYIVIVMVITRTDQRSRTFTELMLPPGNYTFYKDLILLLVVKNIG